VALRGSRLGSPMVQALATLLRSALLVLPVRSLAVLRAPRLLLAAVLVPALQVMTMAAPYWPYAPPAYAPPYGSYCPWATPYFDPMVLTYALTSTWVYWITTLYYLEFFRTMMETWRRMLESFPKLAPAPATA